MLRVLVVVFRHNHSPSRHTTSHFFGTGEAFETFVVCEASDFETAAEEHFTEFLYPEYDSHCNGTPSPINGTVLVDSLVR